MGVSVRLSDNSMRKLNSRVQRLADASGETIREVLTSQMRLLAVDLAFQTAPFGKNNSVTAERSRRAVLNTYRPMGSAVDAIKKIGGEGAAMRFISYIKKRKYDHARKMLRDMLSPKWDVGKFDGGKLHQSQVDKKKKDKKKLVVTGSYKAVESFAKKTARKVGFAKGGFATAANQLGGSRGIPGWARRHKTAPGKGIVVGNDKALSVAMTNEVRHIRAALPKAGEHKALKFRIGQADKRLRYIQTTKSKKIMKS